jgi:hypothetical protein
LRALFRKKVVENLSAGAFLKESYGKLGAFHIRSRTFTFLPRRDVSHVSGETAEKNLG